MDIICNFSHSCLLIKMASKPAIRPIQFTTTIKKHNLNQMQIGLIMCLPSLSLNFLMATISFVSLRKQINRNLVQIRMLTKPIPNSVTKPLMQSFPYNPCSSKVYIFTQFQTKMLKYALCWQYTDKKLVSLFLFHLLANLLPGTQTWSWNLKHEFHSKKGYVSTSTRISTTMQIVCCFSWHVQ